MNFKLYNVDYLKYLCQKYELRPSKNYGQNYLINDDVIDAMLASANLTKKDTVVEVGPGFGVLTQELTEKVKQIYAFEIEKKLTTYWEEKIKNEKFENLEIIWGNILYQEKNEVWKKISTKGGSSSPKASGKSYKVVSNLPYQITSPAIMFFLEKAPIKPKEIIFMVQKEVAERLCAKPGDMSVLAVITQYYCDAQILGAVKRNNFWPEPKVDSAIISLVPKTPTVSLTPSPTLSFPRKRESSGHTSWIPAFAGMTVCLPPVEQAFMFKMVKTGFAQRRKLLVKNLLPLLGKNNKPSSAKASAGKAEILESFQKFQIAATARPQDLSVEQWVQLSTYWIGKTVI